ncbi:class E sortase [Streptomyces sp. Je 1-79]|nr:class E sortase [Streptomyces sp. Je 1-79]MCT4354866.1 class E sortase [Streptomyces sp. Je 1-79]
MTTGSPWFRATNVSEPEPGSIPQAVPGPEETAYAPRPEGYGYDASAYGAGYGSVPETTPAAEAPPYAPQEPHGHQESYDASQEPYESPQEAPYEPYEPRDETMALRTVEEAETPPAGPGRAERRRAAKGRGAKGKGRRGAASAEPASGAPAAPLSRVEARRAARAAKDSVGVVASRVVGELFITFGVVMLLFVTYQLWWTNVRAGQQANQAKGQIEDSWSKGRAPGAFEPGQGFAIMYIPKLDVVVPVAEGINKPKVLDRGMVGHYSEGTLKTAMPGDKEGNFAVAGHRNTHGEPFRYINQLKPGDPIVVETQDAYYTYEMASILPQTAPSNVSVIDPVPKQSGFKGPGRYITLTTCTPEFTSTYRMIVWGKMVEERPRSKGKPDALVG